MLSRCCISLKISLNIYMVKYDRIHMQKNYKIYIYFFLFKTISIRNQLFVSFIEGGNQIPAQLILLKLN
jgi:hypothetical protein